jgi:hypothetical protein
MATDAARSSIGVRVRPNANNFINDLRTDLQGKKYTFYVDIKAQTQGATRDVKRWAATELRDVNAKVYVSANMSRATSDVARWRERQSSIKTQVQVTANMLEAQRDITAWRAIAGRDLEIKVKANVSGRLTEVEKLRKSAEREAKLTVRGDASQVKRDIKQGIDSVDQLSMFTVEVDADTKKAEVSINKFIMQEEQLPLALDLKLDTKEAVVEAKALKQKVEKDNPRAKVLLETAEARRDLAKLRLDAARKKLVVEVDVKTKKWDKFSKKVDQFEKGFGGGSVIRSLDFGPINLGKPTGLLGTMTTITAFAGLVPGLVTGIAALSDGFVRLAGAAAMLPGALASMGAAFGTFKVGMFGFSNALDAMFNVWTESTDKIERNQRNTIKWTNDLTRALGNEKAAQRAITDARRDATNELRNLNNELRGSVLNEAQAILDLQRARDRMAQGDFENQTEYMQAQLDIARADQNVLDVRERNMQLQQKYAQKQQQGVEGSDQVTQALESQARATEAVALAMQSISMANPMGAQSLFEDAMDRLSPKAQAAVRAIEGLRSGITGFQRDLQDTMFDGVAEQITGTFSNLAPTIMPGMNAIAQGLNQNIMQIFDTLNSPDGQSIIERILGGTAEAQQAMTGLIDPLIRGFGTLMAAGAEHMPQLVQLFTTLADRFANFIETADKSGALDKFLDEGITALGNIAELGINVVKIINDFSTAFRSAFGTDLLTKFVEITDRWHEFLSSAEGQQKLNEHIADAKEIWEGWKPILEKLPEIFDKVQNVAMRFLDIFLPALNAIAGVLEKTPGLVEAFAMAWIGGKMLGAAKGILDFGKLIFGVGKAVGQLGVSIGGMLIRMAPYLPLLGKYFNTPGLSQGGGLPTFLPGDKPVGDPKNQKPQSPLGKAGSAAGGILGGPGGLAATTAIVAVPSYIEQNARFASDDAQLAEINKSLPAGVKTLVKDTISGREQMGADEEAALDSLAQQGSPVLKWLMDPKGDDNKVERARRWAYLNRNPAIMNGDPNAPFEPPVEGSYEKGGFTDWPRGVGKNAMLHGQEFVLPAEAVDFYGRDFMESLRQRKLGFAEGGEAKIVDPLSGRTVDPSTTNHGAQPHGLGQQGPGILSAIATGVSGMVSNAANQATNAATGPLPGPAQPGIGTGPIPGPVSVPGLPPVTPGPSPKADPLTMSLGGLEVPLSTSLPTGWPTADGKPPVGLGGGPDGFDIRRFGIGPGPAGSGPADWMKWTTDFIGGTVTNLGSALLGGALDIFGLSGIMSNPYVTSALGLGSHFFGSATGDQEQPSVQAPGADQMNALANEYLQNYAQMPINPAYPGVPSMMTPEMQAMFPGYGVQFPGAAPLPGLNSLLPGGQAGYIPGGTELGAGNIRGGEANLQRATIAGRRILSAAFPFLPEIGGHRESDPYPWHPSGRALDPMIPSALVGTPQGTAIGDAIASYVMQNGAEMGVENVIWNDQSYSLGRDGQWVASPYKGFDNSPTQRHIDHVHIQFKEAGFPDANTKYYAPSSGIIQYAQNEQGFPVASLGEPGTLGSPPNGTTYTPGNGAASGPGRTPKKPVMYPVPAGAPKPGEGGLSGLGPKFNPYGYPVKPGAPKPGEGGLAGLGPAAKSGTASNASSNKSQGGAASSPKEQAKQLYLAAGLPESEWSAFWEIRQSTRAMDQMQKLYGFKRGVSSEAIASTIAHIKKMYQNSPVKALNQFRSQNTFRSGGAVFGQGGPTADLIPAMLSNGEHVLTAQEVEQMGGQESVYRFRDAVQSGQIGGFAWGGAVQALVPRPPPPPKPAPPPPVAQPPAVEPKPAVAQPSPIEQQPPQEPQSDATVPATTPPGPMLSPATAPDPNAVPAPEGTQPTADQLGPQGDETTNKAAEMLQGTGPGAPNLDKLHPALSTGISSGAAALGNIVSTAVSTAATAAAAGGTMGIGAAGGGAAGSLASSLIGGAFQQGGKILEGVANVGANFLVGNLTGGTTSNAYGVRQVANQPSGGTKIYDASTSIGSLHTADLNEYYRMENRRQAQRAQSGLGHWGSR